MKESRSSSSEEAPTLSWRSQARKELIERRTAAAPAERQKWSMAINAHLSSRWPTPPGNTIAFCWPFKAEHDVRAVVERWISMGAKAVLPVVVAPRTPLIFRRWHAGAELASGALGIPYPIDTEEMRPDTILLPANGFDAMGFRLGYGAGYFDRTIARLRPDVRIIGISYEIGRMSSIGPQHHDEPMDFVVTEAGVHACLASRAGAPAL